MRTTEQKQAYRRLSGTGSRRFGFFSPQRYRLWLGEDHVAHVCSTNYSERLKRFYLRDIQAVVVCRTSAGAVLNLILATFAAVLLLGLYELAGAMESTGADRYVFIMVFLLLEAIPLIPLLVNVAKGPTCRCRLYTAVQVEDMVALDRLRRARRAIETLRPLIETAQGRLAPEDFGTQDDTTVEVRAAQHAVPQSAAATGPQHPLRHDSGRLHLATFLMMLIVAVLAALEVSYSRALLDLADTMFFGVAIILAVLALVRQRHSDLPSGVKTAGWAAAITLAVGFSVIQMLATLYLVLANSGDYVTETTPWGATHVEGPLVFTCSAILAVAYATVAVLGLMRLRAVGAVQSSPEPQPTAEPEPTVEPEPAPTAAEGE